MENIAIDQALRVVNTTADELEAAAGLPPVEVASALAVLRLRLDEGDDFDEDEAAAMLALVEALRVFSERYERDLLRHLKHDQGMTWQAIADTLGGSYADRRSTQKRWARLTDSGRRVSTGDYRRGAAVPRLRVEELPQ